MRVQPNEISLYDLWMAYRKTKADIYYADGHHNAVALCEYEDNLDENLSALHRQLKAKTWEWMWNPDFVGGWSVIPKGDIPYGEGTSSKGPDKPECIVSDPDTAWERFIRGNPTPTVSFRQIGVHPIDYHVVTTLWMLKVGYKYDALLGEDAYGSRLRRKAPIEAQVLSEPNLLSVGTFEPYFRGFSSWRKKGLATMRNALEEKKSILAITADVKQFYHQISPDFLVDQDFLKQFKLADELAPSESMFTRAIVKSIHAWAKKTPLHQAEPSLGLPVGLGVSRLIANVALVELDRMIKNELSPLYYGRYVDDIILVIENAKNLVDSDAIWEWIIPRSNGLLEKLADSPGNIRMRAKYLGKSTIEFVGKKQKVFVLKGESGKRLVDSIDRQIRERASEWRALPAFSDMPDALSADLAAACGADGEAVDNLRKADALSLRRASFAIRLRDVEALEHDLFPNQWVDQRNVFFATAIEHVLTLPNLLALAPYVTRLVGLAVACGDFMQASAILARVKKSIELIENDCMVKIAGLEVSNGVAASLPVPDKWRAQLVKGIGETILGACQPMRLKRSEQKAFSEMLDVLNLLAPEGQGSPVENWESAQVWARRLFFGDLGRAPFRLRCLPRELRNGRRLPPGEPPKVDRSSCHLGPIPDCLSSFPKLQQSNDLPTGLLFPTRPFTIQEFYLLVADPFAERNAEKIRGWIRAFRGFDPSDGMPGSRNGATIIPIGRRSGAGELIRIAVASWETRIESWAAAATRRSDPDNARYRRINTLLNELLRKATAPQYLILPELSIPPGWFLRFAQKLAHRGISLIAGVEYVHHGKRYVANQVWASLVTDFLGFSSFVVYRQDKKRPALHEADELWHVAGRSMRPARWPQKPVLCHGDFRFGIMVCSELTNVDYRTWFRGKVDAVFIPEWNQDTESLSTLVEAGAADIHAYIIQCNDRKHGDSRIRSPAKISWKRDIVRLKGGVEDYFVIGEIDVAGLRSFQSAHRSPTGPDAPFKPVPDGFVLPKERRVLPRVPDSGS